MNPLYAPHLSRTDLLSLPAPPARQEIVIAVHRNHSFELVASVLPVFLAQSGLAPVFRYSSYDDSLASVTSLPDADVHLFWLDAGRYALSNFSGWLRDRVAVCQRHVKGRVLVACHGLPVDRLGDMGVPVCDMESILAPLGEQAEDARLEAFSGTRLSNAACLEMARALGMRHIPSLFFPALKALVLDCDNTLYQGVLGEDGISGVKPYLEVQEQLRQLARQGFLLTLASKNEEEDVRELFRQRTDFPLRWDDFAAVGINWRPKAENIREIARQLNIGLDAMLFVDDNPGELLQARQALPEVRLLEAPSPEATVQGLRHYPLLFKSSLNVEDSLRSRDIQANAQRETLREQLSPEAYRRELGITLRLEVNPEKKLERVTELLNKTNQFIFTFKRPDRNAVAGFMHGEGIVVTASMSDRLSDSGLIAVLLAGPAVAGELPVAELVVSCRALGRGIEGGMIRRMLSLACERLNCASIIFPWQKGPRNQPALDWLQTISPTSLHGASGSLCNRRPVHDDDALDGVYVIMQ